MLALLRTAALLLMMLMMLMMPQGASLTLAQRRGLIPKPDKLLSQEEWATVHSLARQRNECSAANCAICLEPFKAEQQVCVGLLRCDLLQTATLCIHVNRPPMPPPMSGTCHHPTNLAHAQRVPDVVVCLQVLLSCSHVFHQQCLASFERHVRVKACPLCRKAWYQQLIINDAAEAYRHACATRCARAAAFTHASCCPASCYLVVVLGQVVLQKGLRYMPSY
jgi:hypothetical protein